MLTYHQGGLVVFIWGQFHTRYLSHHSLKLAWKLPPNIKLKSPRGQWVKITPRPHVGSDQNQTVAVVWLGLINSKSGFAFQGQKGHIQGPIPLMIFTIIMPIQWKFHYAVISNVIATNFCTCHDSCAVVACAKFCSDQMASNGINFVMDLEFHERLAGLGSGRVTEGQSMPLGIIK